MNYTLLKKFCFSFVILTLYSADGQKIKAADGDINKLTNVSEYNLVMEYSENLKIPNYESETDFLDFQFKKKEALEKGLGKRFKADWFENRNKVYRPEYIKAFNAFTLKKRQVRIIEDEETKYTMVVKTFLIYPGYHVEVWYEHTKLEITLTIFETANPENILYSSEIIHAEGRGGSTDKERISTAYLNLGTYLSKYFHRKT